MKPAREPTSSRPKPSASLKNPHESCPFAASCGPRRKNTVVGHQLFPQKPRGCGSSTIELPSAFAESGAYHPIERYQALRKSAPCLSRAATPPEGHQIGARKRRAPWNTILSQPYRRRRVSTDRLNREGSQLTASLEGEPGPTPAGKTLPHTYQVSEGEGYELYSKGKDEPGRVANLARGQLNRRSRLKIWSRETVILFHYVVLYTPHQVKLLYPSRNNKGSHGHGSFA